MKKKEFLFDENMHLLAEVQNNLTSQFPSFTNNDMAFPLKATYSPLDILVALNQVVYAVNRVNSNVGLIREYIGVLVPF